MLERVYRKLSRERFRSAKLAGGVKRACRLLLAEIAIVRPLQVGLDEGDAVILPVSSARSGWGSSAGFVEWSAWAGIRTVEWIYRASTPKGRWTTSSREWWKELEAPAEEGTGRVPTSGW